MFSLVIFPPSDPTPHSHSGTACGWLGIFNSHHVQHALPFRVCSSLFMLRLLYLLPILIVTLHNPICLPNKSGKSHNSPNATFSMKPKCSNLKNTLHFLYSHSTLYLSLNSDIINLDKYHLHPIYVLEQKDSVLLFCFPLSPMHSCSLNACQSNEHIL